MLEIELKRYFRNNNLFIQLGSVTAQNMFDFLTNLDQDTRYISPYIFADKYNIPVNEAINTFLKLIEIEPNILKLVPYFDCQNFNCKERIFFNDDGFENVECLHCCEVYNLERMRKLVKILFAWDPSKLIEPPRCTYDILKGSEAGLKPSPPSLAVIDQKTKFLTTSHPANQGVPLIQAIEANKDDQGQIKNAALNSLSQKFSGNRIRRVN